MHYRLHNDDFLSRDLAWMFPLYWENSLEMEGFFVISGSRDTINTQARFLHLMNEGQGVSKSETMQNHSDSFLSHLCMGKKISSCIRYEKRKQMIGIQKMIGN